MSNWQNELYLKDLWDKFDDGEMTTQEVAKEVGLRIRKLRCFRKYEDELEEIAMEFESCELKAEFNSVLEELYDWADTCLPTPKGQMQKKICWIKTF